MLQAAVQCGGNECVEGKYCDGANLVCIVKGNARSRDYIFICASRNTLCTHKQNKVVSIEGWCVYNNSRFYTLYYAVTNLTTDLPCRMLTFKYFTQIGTCCNGCFCYLMCVVLVVMVISECKQIDVPFGRQLLGNVLSVGSSAAVVCDAGFVPNTTVVTCAADGTWKPSPSACVIGLLNCLLLCI